MNHSAPGNADKHGERLAARFAEAPHTDRLFADSHDPSIARWVTSRPGDSGSRDA